MKRFVVEGPYKPEEGVEICGRTKWPSEWRVVDRKLDVVVARLSTRDLARHVARTRERRAERDDAIVRLGGG